MPLRSVVKAIEAGGLAVHLAGLAGPYMVQLRDPAGHVLGTYGDPLGTEEIVVLCEQDVQASYSGQPLRVSVASLAGQDQVEAVCQAVATELSAWLRFAQASPSMDERRDILSVLSHELKTPLAVIKGLGEMLMTPGAVSESELPEYLRTINRNVARASTAISNLLLMVRLDEGVPGMRPQSMSARDALDLDLYADMAKAKGITLETDLGAGEVRIDHFAAAQIFNNLVTNALKYTPSGGRVLIKIDQHEQEVRYVIQDTGPGIPEEHLPFIFDRFYRVRASANDQGTGLGLYLANRFAEASGGRIWVESRVGEGTVFFVSLPVA